jgi:hypothetical protein
MSDARRKNATASPSKATSEEAPAIADEKKDPFEEIDFGSFFQDYLDPGYRSSGEMEEIEKPSFENFLSKPGNLSDHLLWQLGAISVRPPVHQAAELIIGNLNEEGYLIASDEELLGIAPVAPPEADVEVAAKIVGEAEALGLAVSPTPSGISDLDDPDVDASSDLDADDFVAEGANLSPLTPEDESPAAQDVVPDVPAPAAARYSKRGVYIAGRGEPRKRQATGAATAPARISDVNFTVADLHEALEVVRQFDPQGIACRDLRECLLYQLRYHQEHLHLHPNGNAAAANHRAGRERRDCRRRSASARGDAEAVQGNCPCHRASRRGSAGGARYTCARSTPGQACATTRFRLV